ncbi:MAG: hydrogenase expression/formation protein HypE [Elusimicrobia bacterium]|nr:hydrogenase expression/formation protein HypE [Elusimicrobiota bacterium]
MEGLSCPVPVSDYPNILLAHGGGGRLMHQLLEGVFLPAFGNPMLEARHDGAVVEVGGARLAFTTDAHVVSPLFFPGGDIGTLAVCGTVNDLAMCGAKPLYLSAACILEEGLPVADLRRIVSSMRSAADAAGVRLVTGDTKVVGRGKGDGLFIATAGIGLIEHKLVIAPSSVRPGDAVILSGDVGRHGMAIMAVREGLSFESSIESDTAPLNGVVDALLAAGISVHALRDLTRGGLATCLVEIAEARGVRIDFDESSVPVREDVEGACEMLGFDPLYVANEGRLIAFVPAEQADKAVAAMRTLPVAEDARVIGRVGDEGRPCVVLRSKIGASRLVDMLSGEQLPRIC